MKRESRNLGEQLVDALVIYLQKNGYKNGDHIPANLIAEDFRISRTPVRRALLGLVAEGILEVRPNRGFFLAKDISSPDRKSAATEAPRSSYTNEEIYLAVASDRLDGKLGEKITESELMRRYNVNRMQAVEILGRMAQEGWIERKLGYGWIFLPVFVSQETHVASYRFRMVIEPAAIMEPAFRIDQNAFDRSRAEQESLLNGGIEKMSPPQIYQIQTDFHSRLIQCSGNPFFADALMRHNRLRRLVTYRSLTNRERLYKKCWEHLRVLDMIENGDREEAARIMFKHLDETRREQETYHPDDRLNGDDGSVDGGEI